MQRTLNLYRRGLYVVAGIVLIAALSLAAVVSFHHFRQSKPPPDPVPLAIRQSVGFSVYYPDPAKLPAGYRLDMQSFSNNSLVVVYDVTYSGNQRLVFSVQQKPAATAIQNFTAKRLPLHLTVTTGIGTAAIGVIGTQTVVSLPTSGNAWLLVTGPLNTDQGKLSQVLQALQIAR